MKKKYYPSIEEFENQSLETADRQARLASKSMLDLIDEELNQKSTSRRNFLKFCGFSVASAAVLSSCRNPVNKAIPLLNKPDDITPGMASYYASTYWDGHDYGSILVKVRDGRPIKIEGNTLSPINQGGTTARLQASVLSLYDDGARYKKPLKAGTETSWQTLDSEIIGQLTKLSADGKPIVLLTSTIISPSDKKLIEKFKTKFPTTQQVVYDAVSDSALVDASNKTFKINGVPDYHFENAELVVSFGADFLGTWLMPVALSRRWAESRDLTNKKQLSELHVFESNLSLTGANADFRYPVKPSQQAAILLNLYNETAKLLGKETYPAPSIDFDVKPLAKKLVDAKGKSLVVCGINNSDVQVIAHSINGILGNHYACMDLGFYLQTRSASDVEMENLVSQMSQGKVGALLLWNCNPAYDYWESQLFAEALQKVGLTVSFAGAWDETSALCNYVAPNSHYLESWGDAEPAKYTYSLQQPCIQKIYDTRQAQENLLAWMGEKPDYYAFVQNYWQESIYAPVLGKSFNTFWNETLQKGVYKVEVEFEPPFFDESPVKTAALKVALDKAEGPEVIFYETLALGTGAHANNPWLMELPDPISKVCWDNFAAISPKTAKELKVKNGDKINIVDGVELPVYVLPGQAAGTVAIAYGYGRTNAGKVGNKVGVNIFSLTQLTDNFRNFSMLAKTLTVVAGKHDLVTTQQHHSMENRPIVRETSFAEWQRNPAAGNEMHEKAKEEATTIYTRPLHEGHHWALAIDLNRCTGCSTCVIGCQAENNVPVIGKEQVAKTRIMHWMRIDRYFSDNFDNPKIYFQPIMCQHCDQAPCENVCPVAATNHSNEGLNQIAYNRCIGTKYCINNCPYKVRRFNWFRYATNDKFDFNMNSDLGRMVLNPDVVVRERGVVEKCSFCVQRIQEKKLKAKLQNRQLQDNEIVPACMQACPSKAIVFGDLNDKESRISRLFENERNYHLLEELHVLPNVGYLTKVRKS